jgi:hypothetical protein
MPKRVDISLLDATMAGDEPDNEVTLPELPYVANLLPRPGGALELRPDLVPSGFSIGAEAWVYPDALCGLFTAPETGSRFIALASGPRDAIGAPAGASYTFTGEISGTIFKCSQCIANHIRPGFLAYVTGDPVVRHVVRVVSPNVVQLDSAPSVSGTGKRIVFRASWGMEAGKTGVRFETIGANTVAGPCGPVGTSETERLGGPLISALQDTKSKASVPSWITRVKPKLDDGGDLRSSKGIGLGRDGCVYVLANGKIYRSEDGCKNFTSIGDFPNAVWLGDFYGNIVVAENSGDDCSLSTLDLSSLTLSTVESVDGYNIQAATLALDASGSSWFLAVLFEWVLGEDYYAFLRFYDSSFSIVQDADVSGNWSLGAGSEFVDGVPAGINGGDKPSFLFPGRDAVFLITENGQIFKFSIGGTDEQIDGKGESKALPVPAYRYRGAWYTQAYVFKPLTSSPVGGTSHVFSGTGKVAVVTRTLNTFLSDSGEYKSGIWGFQDFSVTEADALTGSGIPAVFHLAGAGFAPAFPIFIDEHGQIFLNGRLVTETLRRPSYFMDGNSSFVSDRGIVAFSGTSSLLPEIAGAAGSKFITRSGLILNGDGSVFYDLGFTVSGVAADGTGAAVIASGSSQQLAYYDGSTVTVVNTPTAFISAIWASSNFILLGTNWTVYRYVPGTGLVTVGSSLSHSGALIGAVNQSGYAVFAFEDGITVISPALAISQYPLDVTSICAGPSEVLCVDSTGAVYTLSPGVWTRVDAGYNAYPYSVLFHSGSLYFCPRGVGFFIEAGTSSDATIYWHNLPTDAVTFQSGRTFTYYGIPIVYSEESGDSFILDDRGQPRAKFSVSDLDGPCAYSSPQGLAGVGTTSFPVFSVLPGSAGVGLLSSGSAVLTTNGGVQRLDPAGAVTTIYSDSGSIYCGGRGIVFAAFPTKVIRTDGTTYSEIATGAIESVGAADSVCSVFSAAGYFIFTASGSSLFPRPETTFTRPVVCPGTLSPVLLVTSGAVRGTRTDSVPRVLIYGSGGWREVGPAPVRAKFALYGSSRVTLASENTLRDISSWGGTEFEPISENFWAPVWAVAGGHLVLFGTTEIEEGKIVYHRRRIRWSAPLAPRDFETLEASGLADLYPDTGDFISAAGITNAIIYADEAGLGVLEATFDPAAPWANRRLANTPLPISPLVALGQSVLFVADDGWLWAANVAGAQRVRQLPMAKAFGSDWKLQKYGLFHVKQLQLLFVTTTSGSNCTIVLSVPEFRCSLLTTTPADALPYPDSAQILTVVDGSSVGEPAIVSLSPFAGIAPRLLKFSSTYSGVDNYGNRTQKWYGMVITPPQRELRDVAVLGLSVSGGERADSVLVGGLTIGSNESLWDHPEIFAVTGTDGGELVVNRAVSTRWRTPYIGVVTLWGPHWSGRLLDNGGNEVPYTAISDFQVTVSVPTPGFVTFTGAQGDVLSGEKFLLLKSPVLIPFGRAVSGSKFFTLVPETPPMTPMSLRGFRSGSEEFGPYKSTGGGAPRFVSEPRFLVVLGAPGGYCAINAITAYLSARNIGTVSGSSGL